MYTDQQIQVRSPKRVSSSDTVNSLAVACCSGNLRIPFFRFAAILISRPSRSEIGRHLSHTEASYWQASFVNNEH